MYIPIHQISQTSVKKQKQYWILVFHIYIKNFKQYNFYFSFILRELHKILINGLQSREISLQKTGWVTGRTICLASWATRGSLGSCSDVFFWLLFFLPFWVVLAIIIIHHQQKFMHQGNSIGHNIESDRPRSELGD